MILLSNHLASCSVFLPVTFLTTLATVICLKLRVMMMMVMLMAITVYTASVRSFLSINPDQISHEDHFDRHESPYHMPVSYLSVNHHINLITV